MNTSGDAAEQIVRMSLEGFQVTAKIAGSGAKDIAALLIAIMKDKHKTAGKTNLSNMLKSGKELKVFSVRKDEFKKFTEEAKRYGVLYSALINKKDKSSDGIIDIMVRAEDAAKINRIVERFKLSSYDEATIRSEIQKTKEMKSKDKGVKTKTQQDLESRKNEVKYDYKVFGINMDRQILYDRINQRVDIMLEQGLIEEVKYILKKYTKFPTAMQGLRL